MHNQKSLIWRQVGRARCKNVSDDMLRFLAVSYLLVAASAGSPIGPQILGGSDTAITDVPYVLSVEFFGIHYCGAVIISADWALTDAWCTLEPVDDVSDMAIRSGSAILGTGTFHRVLQWIHHPQNNVYAGEYDFALVQVDPPFEFDENVAAVTLPDQEQGTPDGVEAQIAGWGQVDGSEDLASYQLQSANITTFGEAACLEYLAVDYQKSKLCAQNPNGQVAACSRDEGGPLVIDGILYGITRYPTVCSDPLSVQIFARVASVRNWIDVTTRV